MALADAAQETRVSVKGMGGCGPNLADPSKVLPDGSILSSNEDGGCDLKLKRTVPSLKLTFRGSRSRRKGTCNGKRHFQNFDD